MKKTISLRAGILPHKTIRQKAPFPVPDIQVGYSKSRNCFFKDTGSMDAYPPRRAEGAIPPYKKLLPLQGGA